MWCPNLASAIARIALSALALVGLAGCGGSSSAPPPMYSIGGTLSGIGAGQSVVLHDNGGDDLAVGAAGTFTFATKVKSGGSYLVTATVPTGTICTIAGGSGTASADVTTVVVSCDATYSIGGSVSGVAGQGLILELSSPGTDQLLEIGHDGNFVFPSHASSADSFSVSVKQQPNSPRQRCFVERGESLPGGMDATDVSVVCAEFAYVANGLENTIYAFSINPTTGTLASVGPRMRAGQSPRVMFGSRDLDYIYVLNSGGGDVSEFAVDSASGKLAAVDGSPFATGTSPSGFAYFAGFLADYEPRDQRFRSYLYIADAGSDSLSAYDSRSTIPVPLSPASYPTGAGPSVLARSPTSEFLYTANSGSTSDISAFAMEDFASGVLKPIPGSPFSSGSNVKSLAFSGDGKHLYGANVTGATAAIYGFNVDPNSGALTSLAGFPFALPSCTYVAVDRSGTYLYATAGTNIIGYLIDAQTGSLKPLTGFPLTAGGNVQSVSIDSTNQFLYVANGSAETVTGFTLNEVTGGLTPMLGSPFVVGASADFLTTF